jgi:hypothetical protein
MYLAGARAPKETYPGVARQKSGVIITPERTEADKRAKAQYLTSKGIAMTVAGFRAISIRHGATFAIGRRR